MAEPLTLEQLDELLTQKIREALEPLTKVDRKLHAYPGLSDEDIDKMDPKQKVAEFIRSVVLGDEISARALSEGTDVQGGYLVPEEFRADVIRRLADPNYIRPIVFVIPMDSDTLTVPRLTSSVAVYWEAENATWTDSDIALGQLKLTVHRMNGLNYSSRELFQDTKVNLVDLIETLFAEAIGEEENNVFITGNGSGKPMGLQNAAGIGAVAQGGASLTADDLIELFHTLKKKYRRNAYWFIHGDIVKKIRKLKDDDGKYIWQEGLKEGTPDMLLGRPIIELDVIPTNLGAGSDESIIFFGNPKYYYLGDREEMGFESTTQGAGTFEKHQVAIKVWERIDGNVALTDAFKKLTGVK